MKISIDKWYGFQRKFGMVFNRYIQKERETTRVTNISSEIRNESNDLKGWILNESNRIFFKRFFDLLNPSVLKYDDFNDYVKSGKIYNDVYFFDAVKCRCKTEDLKNSNFINCIKNFFERELDLLTKIELIFVFSTRSWEAFNTIYSPVPKRDCFPSPDGRITKCHGYLYSIEINRRIVKVIPLVHMSPISFNNTLRDSYFDYLMNGLDLYLSEMQNQ